MFWNLVVSGLITWAIVRSGVLQRLENRLGRRGPNVRMFVVGIVYFLVSAVLRLPWSLYEDWWRELSYELSSQPLADFLGQSVIGILIFAVLGAVFLSGFMP